MKHPLLIKLKNWLFFIRLLGYRRMLNWFPHQHDVVFQHFQRSTFTADGRFSVGLLGERTSPQFYAGIQPSPVGQVVPKLPSFDDHYPEWVFLLESMVALRDRQMVTLVELGAGWGPWLARGRLALGSINSSARVRLLGVEANRRHHDFLVSHLAVNCRPEDEIHTEFAAVGDTDGTAWFDLQSEGNNDYGRKPSTKAADGSGKSTLEAIPSRSLATLLGGFDRVDYLTIDIQGAEGSVVPGAMDLLRQRVRFLQIETHSPEIDRLIAECMQQAGWQVRFQFPFHRVCKTPWGLIRMEGGSHAYVNPRLD
jgi:FkbM family methyltransferase